MPEEQGSDPPFWIHDKDDSGELIDPGVLAAAERIWTRAVHFTRSALHDAGRAAEILEATAAAVSRAIRRKMNDPVQDMDAYLLWAFARKLSKIMAKEHRLQAGHSADNLAYLGAVDQSAASDLDAEVQLRELLSYMDSRTRQMFILRCEDYSWRQIARKTGLKNAHSAEVQFNKGVRAARLRLLRRRIPKSTEEL